MDWFLPMHVFDNIFNANIVVSYLLSVVLLYLLLLLGGGINYISSVTENIASYIGLDAFDGTPFSSILLTADAEC